MRRSMRHFSPLAAVAALLMLLPSCAVHQAGSTGLANLMVVRDYQTMRASSSDPDWRDGNMDFRPIPPGETLVLAELEGPGVIRHFWNTIAASERGYSRLLVLRIYWDGEEHPSVEVPIGDFFGIGHGMDVSYTSLPVTVSAQGRARNSFWPMPFARSARITVTNEGRGHVHNFYYYINWEKVPRLPADFGYFHAKYRQEHPAIMGRNYLIADIEGRGHYVGTVLNVRQHEASWFGEGDDFFFIDGEEEPSLRGTGTEDYFCDAWGFRVFDAPFFGVPVFGNYQPMDRITAYRWHVLDPIRFTKSLRVEIEHKGALIDEDGRLISGFIEREDDFSSVAFWYQTVPHKPYEPLPPAYDRLYYDPADILEAEDFLEGAEATAGHVGIQEGAHWSGGAQVFWTPQEEGHELTVPFRLDEAGRYALMLVLTTSWDYGVFDVALNGEVVLTRVNLYSGGVGSTEHHVPPRELEAGVHTLSFRNVGKARESDGFYFGLDGILPQPR